ncbi:hypothetical protein ACLOJK_035410 [Asimina triloba]
MMVMSLTIFILIEKLEKEVRESKLAEVTFKHFAATSIPKGIHCLSLRLTDEYSSNAHARKQLPPPELLRLLSDNAYFHFVIASDNILAASVVVTSTVRSFLKPDKVVFHVITDKKTYASMHSWFALYPPSPAIVEVKGVHQFDWLTIENVPMLEAIEKHLNVRNYYLGSHTTGANFSERHLSLASKLQSRSPKYISLLNHLRIYLPEVLPQLFPNLDKVVFLDDDVVIQRDLSPLWEINLGGKVNGAVETCNGKDSFKSFKHFKDYLNFSHPLIAKSLNPKDCNFYSTNLNSNWTMWKLGTLPPALIAFKGNIHPIDPSWHVLGLGYHNNTDLELVKQAAVIHYNGQSKPWLEIAFSHLQPFWTKVAAPKDMVYFAKIPLGVGYSTYHFISTEPKEQSGGGGSSETGTMSDRCFRNEMPEFVPETVEEGEMKRGSDSLTTILHLPYPKLAQKFLQRALPLKDKIVKETWIRPGHRVRDFTLYTGSLGTAYLLFKAYEVTQNKSDLTLCMEIVKACEAASRESGHVTFICGRAGVCALGAVAANNAGDHALMNHYLSLFKAIKMPERVPNELLYGRSGFLWACSFLNKYIGKGTIPSTYTDGLMEGVITKEIIKDGMQLSRKGSCPLMYEWHGKKYWGAAHGLAGIMHVLMDMELTPEEQELVKGTLCYMVKNRFASGNYPSSEGKDADRLVHWCHGAPGIALTLAKAAEVFHDEMFLKAAVDAGELVWNQGLLKRVGICHGVSGNAYVFLTLYRLTGDVKFLYKAKAFASFLLDKAENLILEGRMHGGDRPYSLFEGSGGMAYLLLDMTNPAEGRFPAYEL